MAATTDRWVLGIAASHNGAACLLKNGEVFCAIQEERLSRVKRDRIDAADRSLAVQYCLDAARITPGDLALVVACTQSAAKHPRHDLGLNPQLQVHRHGTPTRLISHHLGHAASALALSGESDAAILVVDGAGSPLRDLAADEAEVVRRGAGTESISLYEAIGGEIHSLEKVMSEGAWLLEGEDGMPRFSSLGGMYSAVAWKIFGDAMEAGKVMGLAPLGKPTTPVSAFFDLRDDDLVFKSTVCEQFSDLEKWPADRERSANLAASVQQALETALLGIARRLQRLTGAAALCYAGGVALNGIANERILREAGFQRLYIPAAAEDSGTAIGAAYVGDWSLQRCAPRARLSGDRMGRTYSSDEISTALDRTPFLPGPRSTAAQMRAEVVDRLVSGEIGGWFEGGSELGPRALGQRSIIADPRRSDTKTKINARIKRRESFRPFAPAILAEAAADWFDVGHDPNNPFMLRIWPFRTGMMERVPAAAHADFSGRAQTVHRDVSPAFYDLIASFRDKSGVPILLNTSFNGPGDPIVETPEDALWTMAAHGLDFVVLEGQLIPRGDVASFLDFIPVRAFETFEIQHRVRADAPALCEAPERLLIQVDTAWGPKRRQLPMKFAPLLDAIDGARDGHAVVERLKVEGNALASGAIMSMLGQLGAQKIITLATPAHRAGQTAQSQGVGKERTNKISLKV